MRELSSTLRGKAALLCEFFILAGMVPFIIVDLLTIRVNKWGWFSPWHALDLLIYGLQSSVLFLHLAPAWPAVSLKYMPKLIGFQCILM